MRRTGKGSPPTTGMVITGRAGMAYFMASGAPWLSRRREPLLWSFFAALTRRQNAAADGLIGRSAPGRSTSQSPNQSVVTARKEAGERDPNLARLNATQPPTPHRTRIAR